MDRVPLERRHNYASYARTGDCGITNGRVEATTEAREKVWDDWKAFCEDVGVPPYLDGCDFSTIARVATMYGGKLRQGKRGRPVSAGTVRAGLGGVATTIALDTGEQPLHQKDGNNYIKPVQHMLAGFKNFDPAVEKKLACAPDLPHFACEWAYRAGTGPQQQAIGDLIVIAYYYLLRIGEYTTKVRRKKKTRTRQFRAKDVTFYSRNKWGDLVALPRNASTAQIMAAEAATLRISNQKNGHAGACVHHSTIEGAAMVCPIRALGRRYLHIREHAGRREEAFLCSYWDDVGRGDITDGAIRYAIKHAARVLDYPARGIPIKRVDTHSLRSGGACALKLAGYGETEIKKMGRWAPESQAFLEYIQQQLSTFSAGMASAMSRVARFTNMEGATTAEDLRGSTVY